MQKLVANRKVLLIVAVLAASAVFVVLSVKQAAQLEQNHDEMKSVIDGIPSARLDSLNYRYTHGIAIYYSIDSYSGIYQYDPSDTLYDEFEMGKWVLEPDSAGSFRIFAPDFGWNPEFSDLEERGWQLSGEVGSSITLTNPRYDPDGFGTLRLEVIERDPRGTVFVLGQGPLRSR